MQNRTVSRAQKGRIVPGPRIFQPRQPWLGAHSCLRGHIWLVTIRTSFSNQADIAIMCFWLKCAPLNNEFGSNVPPKTWKTSISALFLVIVHINTVCTYYALLSRVQLCRDYALFGGGHFGPKFAGWGHTNIFEDRVQGILIIIDGQLLCKNHQL